MDTQRKLLLVLLGTTIFSILPFDVRAQEQTVTLGWEPGGTTQEEKARNADGTDFYTIYWKYKNPDAYGAVGNEVDVDPAVSCTDTDADGIHDTCSYTISFSGIEVSSYFVATASNTAGESDFSNEVKHSWRAADKPGNLNKR